MKTEVSELTNPTTTARRPIGVWLMTIITTIVAAVRMHSVSPGLRDPLPHAWSPQAAVWAPYVVTFLLIIIGAAWAAWARLKYARAILLTLLTLLVAMPVLEGAFYGVPFLLSMAESDSALWRSPGFWLSLTSGLWWLLWLALNYWYYLGPPTRDFYTTTDQR